MKEGDRHRLKREPGNASIGCSSDHLMVDQIEAQFDPAWSIWH